MPQQPSCVDADILPVEKVSCWNTATALGPISRSKGMALVHDSFSDFVLFPRDPSSYLDMLDARGDNGGFDGLQYNVPTTSNMQQLYSDSVTTSYEPYPSAMAYSSGSSPYHGAPQFVLDLPKGDARQEARRWTPSGSPSPSASQCYEHPPSAVSSVSGASGQSTASSAVGSPYSHATQTLPGQEHWTDPRLGLGIAPGTFHDDRLGNDIFPSSNIDNDLIFEDGKYPSSFVGKSGNISPSSSSVSRMNSSAISSSRNFVSAFHTPHLALDTSVATRDVTIDTILEEVNSSIGTPSQLASPASAVSTKASPIASRGAYPTPSTPYTSGSFRAPTTPASAMSSFALQGFSPPALRQPNPRSHSTAVCGDAIVHRSPPSSSSRFQPYGRSIMPPVSQNQFHHSQSQPPFFSQSSGRYIAPLESSCWFSSIGFLPVLFLGIFIYQYCSRPK